MSLIFHESARKGPLSDRLRLRGYTITETKVGGKLLVKLTSPSGYSWLTGANMSYPTNSHAVYELSGDKQRSYALAEALGIAIPRSMYVEAGEVAKGVSQFFSVGSRLVVKPLDSFKAKGVSLGIENEQQLKDALSVSFQESPVAIIQEQVEGEEYRFSLLNGKVVSVLRRERPQVIGNGKDSISQLVHLENIQRAELVHPVLEYPKWTEELIGPVVTSDEVLLAGERRILSSTTLVSKGASVYEMIADVDRSYIDIAECFADEINAGFVAVDMFLLDHSVPASSENYRFNECNSAPSLKMYLTPRNCNTENIIDMVVEEVDKALNNIQKSGIIVDND